MIGADIPICSRLKVAHEFKSLRKLLLQDVCLWVLYLLEEVCEHGDLSGPTSCGVCMVDVLRKLKLPSGCDIFHVVDQSSDLRLLVCGTRPWGERLLLPAGLGPVVWACDWCPTSWPSAGDLARRIVACMSEVQGGGEVRSARGSPAIWRWLSVLGCR